MEKELTQRKTERIDADIDRAVEAVRKRYGNDFMAFFADVQRHLSHNADRAEKHESSETMKRTRERRR